MAYENDILEILKKGEWKSTTELMKEIRKQSKKAVNWITIYRALERLEKEGKIQRIERKGLIIWSKK